MRFDSTTLALAAMSPEWMGRLSAVSIALAGGRTAPCRASYVPPVDSGEYHAGADCPACSLPLSPARIAEAVAEGYHPLAIPCAACVAEHAES